ncbi:MAG: hypothetical protein ABSF69_05660 [Polyangiaceae bacterium]
MKDATRVCFDPWQPAAVNSAATANASGARQNIRYSLGADVDRDRANSRDGRPFQLRPTRHVVGLGLGALLMSLMLARAFGKFYGGL